MDEQIDLQLTEEEFTYIMRILGAANSRKRMELSGGCNNLYPKLCQIYAVRMPPSTPPLAMFTRSQLSDLFSLSNREDYDRGYEDGYKDGFEDRED